MSEQHRDHLLGFAETEEFRDGVVALFGPGVDDEAVEKCIDDFRESVEEIFERSNPDPIATVLHPESFEFPIPNKPGQTSPVEVTITLLPEKFWQRDKFTDRPGGTEFAKKRHIDENEGISILRAGREIYYGILRGVQPTVEKVDRFIGIEIRFRPELDECFQVRNVKKGAEPVEGLRDKLQSIISKTVETGRQHLSSSYAALKAKQQNASGIHAEAEQVVQGNKDVSPRPRAGENVPKAERDRKIREAAAVLTKDNPARTKEVADAIGKRPLTLIPQAWPGSDFMQIEHLGSTAIVRLNTQHPFYTEVYSKLVDAMEAGEELDVAELARVVQVGLDILIMSFAQAEGVETDGAAKYANLRAYWGIHLNTNVQSWANSRPR